MNLDNDIDENNIWVKSMKRYHKYIDEFYGIKYDDYEESKQNIYQLRNAKRLMQKWFKECNNWFGVKIKINSIEDFNMIADLIGY